METYKGYTIEHETEPWAIKFGQKVYYYPTEQGIQDDADYDDGWHYCGNRHWTGSVEEAKDEIDAITDETPGL